MHILLIDDHAVVREGFHRILADVFRDLTVGEASNAQEALAHVRAQPWDLAVLDISLPGRGGLEALEDIHAIQPGLPVLMMTMHAEEHYALRAFRAGAAGFITKGSPRDALVEAVRKVYSGGKYVSPTLAEHLASQLVVDTERPVHEALSNRELQVLRMFGTGLTVKTIGLELKLSVKTISTYRARILEKLDMSTTADIVRYAIRADLAD